MFRRSLSLILILVVAPPASAAPPFELRDGDRVVMIGDTLIEREQHYGWIELALTTRFPDRNVTFRNIGWSADTPAGDSRFGLSLLQAGLEPPDEGWKQLQNQIRQLKPTVVILGYGMASSFAGEAGLPKFVTDMNRLMDTIQELAGEQKVRFLILSPIRHLPSSVRMNTDAHNAVLARYIQALREMASNRGAAFVSFFDSWRFTLELSSAISENGIHLESAGYRRAAFAIEDQLGWGAGRWFPRPQMEKLRQVIIKKNELFFHRSRPANMAYIMGFRRGEQGKNAVEIPQFDPLIEAEEKKIALLRSLKPVELPSEPPPRTESAVAKFTPQPHPTFTVAEGLEVNLWAENPLLAKPIQMNWDPRGRLWVASSEDYPQIEPGQTPNDKIIVLEDTTGAGKADKSTVFADGLLIPTGLEPGDGGVYVAQSTELLHLCDPKGTGKATERHIVLSGFGTEDTHHNLHTLRWGPDGRLYMNQSVYTRTDTETPHGVVRLKSGGVFRFDPRTQKLDILFRGWWNSWGHAFDAYGQSFLTDGAGGDGISWGIPGAMYSASAKARRLLGSISPGSYPKFSGLEIVYSKHFPDDWQGDMITCDFRANRVVRFKVAEDGAGYVAREVGDLLRGNEATFRPIDVKLGPDGALYIADWSNPIINHGEVDFRDPRRDRWHGRIWRVTAKGRALNQKPKVIDASDEDLFNHLSSPNAYDRAQARRVIIERGLTFREAWLRVLNTFGGTGAPPSPDLARLQILCLWNTFGKQPLPAEVLRSNDGRVRAAIVRILSDLVADGQFDLSRGIRNRTLELMYDGLMDPHPRVRLEAVRALARIPTALSAREALTVLDKPMDRFLDYALWLTVNELADPWLTTLEKAPGPLEGHERMIEFTLKAVEPDKAGKALAALLAKNPLTRDGRGPWIELIGQAGGPAEVRKLFDQAIVGDFDAATTARALRALGQAARLRRVRPPGDLAPLGKLLDHTDESVRAAVVALVGRWRLSEYTARVLALASEKSTPGPVRSAAFDALRDFRGPNTVSALRGVIPDESESVAVRRQAALALLNADQNAGLPLVRELLSKTTDQRDAVEFWRSVIGQTGVSPRLAATLRNEPIPEAAAAVGLRVVRESAGRHGQLEQVLTRLAGNAAPKNYTPGDVQRMAALAALRGDARRGELVYRRPELKCIACHSIGGAGGKVGPDMTSLGAAAPLDYLVESVLLPNKTIKEGFHSLTITTTAGRSHTGILVRETDREVILRDADNKEIAVAKNTIDERTPGGSLMPAGLVDALFDGERDDLFKFLSELGKPGPFDVTKSSAARLWHLIAVNHVDSGRAQRGDPQLPGWTPVTTTVGGVLRADDVKAILPKDLKDKQIFAVTRFEVTKAGPVTLTFGGAPAGLWIDGKMVEDREEVRLELDRGTHTLAIPLDWNAVLAQVALHSPDVVFRPD
jgi:putative heme-binding domain-containing protein